MAVENDPTLGSRRSDARICRERGWGPGTRLVGDEGYGPTIIEITAVGDEKIMAKRLAHAGRAVAAQENSWVLWCRDWSEFTDEIPRPIPVGTAVLVTVPAIAPLDHEPGLIESGPTTFGMYRIHCPGVPGPRKWIVTDKFEVVHA